MSIHRQLLSPTKYNRPIWFQGNDAFFFFMSTTVWNNTGYFLTSPCCYRKDSNLEHSLFQDHTTVFLLSVCLEETAPSPTSGANTEVGFPVFLRHAFLPILTSKVGWAICLQKFLPEHKCVLSVEKFEHQVDSCLCQKKKKIACADNSWKNLDMSKFPVPLSKRLLLGGGFFLCRPRCVSTMDVSTGNLIQVHVF